MTPPDLFSKPFEELEPGQRFTTAGRTVTEADVATFAGLTGDFHPQHTDAAWAAESAFGERVAHGMLVLGVAAGLVPFDPEWVIALRRVRDAVFKRPVCLGDTIQVEGRVAAVTPIDDKAGLVAVALTVAGAEGRTVARIVVEVVWRREGAPIADGDPTTDPAACVPL